jgi:hypothetical protein
MLQLNLNAINKLDVVCADSVTVLEPIYLWRFKNKMTQVQSLIELTDQIPNNRRFSQFLLDLPNDLDLTSGDYEWFLYQSTTSGQTDFENMTRLTFGDMRIITNFDLNNSYEPTASQDYEYNG